MTTFEICLQHVLKHEGGYVDHPVDPGGATNMGITRKTLAAWRGYPVTKDEMRSLTVEETSRIYRAKYWNLVRGDDLPPPLALVAFDCAVNQGPARAKRWLQESVGAVADGVIGPNTVAKANAVDTARAVIELSARRMWHYTGLSIWPTFRKGWTRRLLAILWAAARLA